PWDVVFAACNSAIHDEILCLAIPEFVDFARLDITGISPSMQSFSSGHFHTSGKGLSHQSRVTFSPRCHRRLRSMVSSPGYFRSSLNTGSSICCICGPPKKSKQARAGMILEELGITDVVTQRLDRTVAADVHHLEAPFAAADVKNP